MGLEEVKKAIERFKELGYGNTDNFRCELQLLFYEGLLDTMESNHTRIKYTKDMTNTIKNIMNDVYDVIEGYLHDEKTGELYGFVEDEEYLEKCKENMLRGAKNE